MTIPLNAQVLPYSWKKKIDSLAAYMYLCNLQTKSTNVSSLHIYIIMAIPYQTTRLFLAIISWYIHEYLSFVMFFFWLRRSGGMGTMRRGMLMTILQQYALDQPVWKGKPGEKWVETRGSCIILLHCILRGQDASCDIHVVSFPDPTLKERKVSGDTGAFSWSSASNANSHMIAKFAEPRFSTNVPRVRPFPCVHGGVWERDYLW